jgi:organic radical activating enzyme
MVKSVLWVVTTHCNYSCHFCTRFNNTLNISKEDCYKIINFINKMNENNKIKLDLFGGEPFIYLYLDDIIENVNYTYFGLTTNLSISIERLRSIINKIKNKTNNIKICATFHAQYADPNEFYKKINFLYENDINISINFTIETINENYIKEKYYPLYCKIKNNMNIIFNIYGYNHILLPEKSISLFNIKDFKHKESITKIKPFNKNKGKKINCHNEILVLDYKGNVYKCEADTDLISSEKPLYNVLDKNALQLYKFYNQIPLICNSDWCCKSK